MRIFNDAFWSLVVIPPAPSGAEEIDRRETRDLSFDPAKMGAASVF